MTIKYAAVSDNGTKLEADNPGEPLWKIILCQVISLAYDFLCRPMKTRKDI